MSLQRRSVASRPCWPWLLVALAWMCASSASALGRYESGSDGSDGALDFSWAIGQEQPVVFDPASDASFDPESGRVLDVDGDNVFHFTTVVVPSGVTVRLRSPELRWRPVTWLVSGDVVIAKGACLDLSGENGAPTATVGEGRYPALPGPGGHPGGLGASGLSTAQPGAGPGGGHPSATGGHGAGGSHATVGEPGSDAAAGEIYGSPFLLPLMGGSGGAGGGHASEVQYDTSGSGGGGGGAIVIASTTVIALEGCIRARGGDGSGNEETRAGGGGSGGAVRLVAPTVRSADPGGTQSGGAVDSGEPEADEASLGSLEVAVASDVAASIDVSGGSSVGADGGAGRIRIETTHPLWRGNYWPDTTATVRVGALVPTTPIAPTDPRVPRWPSVRVASINGVVVPSDPSSSFSMPDVSLETGSAVTVVFAAENIPTEAELRFRIASPDAGWVEITPEFVSGTTLASTWTAEVAFPPGFSRGYLQATFGVPKP